MYDVAASLCLLLISVAALDVSIPDRIVLKLCVVHTLLLASCTSGSVRTHPVALH